MLTNREPDWNIDDLTDTEIYDAICYLEPAPTTAAEQDSGDQDQGDGVVICVCLYIALRSAWPSCGSTGDDALLW